MSFKRYLVSIPQDALPGQYRPGDYLTWPNGQLFRIVGTTTVFLLIRETWFWERWRLKFSQKEQRKCRKYE